MKFSALPLRSLRLRGELFVAKIYRRGAEIAETAQRKPELQTLPDFIEVDLSIRRYRARFRN